MKLTMRNLLRVKPTKWGPVSGVLIAKLVTVGYHLGIDEKKLENGETVPVLSVWFSSSGRRPRIFPPFTVLARTLKPVTPDEKWVKFIGKDSEGSRFMYRFQFLLEGEGEESEEEMEEE